MKQDAQHLRAAKERLAASRARAELEAQLRRAEVYAACPEIAQVDAATKQLGFELMKSAISTHSREDKATFGARIDAQKANIDALLSDREELLRAAGFPSDYLQPRYACPLCNDTGYADGKMCICLKKQVAMERFEHSGLGALIRTQSFESFDLSFYTGAERIRMEQNLDICRSYAADFDETTTQGLLLTGPTGLGKTHLSTAIARQVMEKGYDVYYVTATELFRTFEETRFAREGDTAPNMRPACCDLLILDDLGTEPSTQYSVSCLYELLNARINREKPWIINTNLGADELQKKYQDRIVSRLFGSSRALLFQGRDVRLQKLQRRT